MLLYSNGDSHSLGAMKDGATGKSFVTLVAKHFNLDLVNESESASSVARVIRTTRDYLIENKPKLVLIGWGTWEREEWLHENKYYPVMVGWYKHLPAVLQERYKSWVVEQTPEMLIEKSREWHKQIYSFHLELEQKNIKHLFFNCMYDFFLKFQLSDAEPYDWNSQFIGPYNNDLSYHWYLKNKGYKCDKWYHYNEDGHYEWAKFLINYIRENKLI